MYQFESDATLQRVWYNGIMEPRHGSDTDSISVARSRYKRGSLSKKDNAIMSLPFLIANSKERSYERRRAYEENPDKCKYCDGVLLYGRDRRSRFCNRSCAAKFNNRGKVKNGVAHPFYGVERGCQICGNPVRQFSLAFCSRKCGHRGIYLKFIEGWKRGDVDGRKGADSTSSHINRYLREKFGNKCSRCGWDEVNTYTKKVPVQVHHKDGDHRNMIEDNLDLLCPNCHSLTPTHGGRNKGRGRDSRQLWRKKNKLADIAQVGEHRIRNAKVGSSSDPIGSRFAALAQM